MNFCFFNLNTWLFLNTLSLLFLLKCHTPLPLVLQYLFIAAINKERLQTNKTKNTTNLDYWLNLVWSEQFWVLRNYGLWKKSKKFVSKKKVCPKKFVSQKNFGLEKIWVLIKKFSQKILSPKKILVPRNRWGFLLLLFFFFLLWHWKTKVNSDQFKFSWVPSWVWDWQGPKLDPEKFVFQKNFWSRNFFWVI